MRKFIILISICLAAAGTAYGQEDTHDSAESKLKMAVRLMDDGIYEEALALLNEAEALDPRQTYIYTYEKAFLYDLKKDYKTAVSLLKKSAKYDDATDLVYEMWGNAYDYMGNPDKALKIYAKGIKKFPGSGRLCLESGVVHVNKGEYGKAVDWYKRGTMVDPYYPSNYYHLAYLLINSNNPAYGMAYGETFMNLEAATERTTSMSRILYKAYTSYISFPTDSTTSLNFSSKEINLNIDANAPFNFVIPFPLSYEIFLTIATGGERSIDLASLDRIRSRFIDLWFAEDSDYLRQYPYAVFEHQRKIREAGHLEAYNYWLLGEGDIEAFNKWHSTNSEKYGAFIAWFNENHINFD